MAKISASRTYVFTIYGQFTIQELLVQLETAKAAGFEPESHITIKSYSDQRDGDSTSFTIQG